MTMDENQSSEDWFAEVKKSYLNILAQLEFDLGSDYKTSLATLRFEIEQARHPSQLSGLRKRLEELVRYFARHVFDEREKVASFIAELIRRIDDVEGHIVASVGHTVKLHQSGEAFTSDMVSAIDQVSDSVKSSEKLTDLKNLVLIKLHTFKQAVESQRQQEKDRIREISREIESLKGKFDQVKDKLEYLEKENRELATKVRIDPLTGVYNRRALEERLGDEMNRFQRYGRIFSLIIFDLDRFKHVNDTYGHPVGDKCLKEVASLAAEGLRRSDTLARYGGDEFVAVLPETDLERAFTVAQKLCRIIDETEFLFREQVVPITLSLGVTQVRAEDPNWEEVLHRADQALYRAKDAGGNRAVKD